jgi:hypothetical protein
LGNAICCANIHAFSDIYRRTTALRLFLVLHLIQIFPELNVYVNNGMFPLSVIIALTYETLEEAEAKQMDCILETRTGYCWKNYW